MKLEISYKELKSNLVPSLIELNKVKINAAVAYNAAKSLINAQKELETIEKARTNILLSRCKMENGAPVLKDQQVTFDTPEIQQEVENIIDELKNKVVELDIFPISIKDLGNIEISGHILIGLGVFINEP